MMPGGLNPVEIDVEEDKGTYIEPAIWMELDHSPCVNAEDSWVISSNPEKLTKRTPWAPRLKKSLVAMFQAEMTALFSPFIQPLRYV